MIRRLLPILTGWALFALATPAAAQSPLAFRGFGTIAVEQQAAKDSFDAVTGSTTLTSFGAGVQVTNIWRRLFVEIGAERASLDGERVFVDGSTVERLGIPVEITVAPLDVMAGWRFGSGRGRLTPYAAAGLTSIGYSESSDFADNDENVDERASGVVLAAGVEVRLRRLIHLRGEMRFRQAGGVLGDQGVSQEYGEKNLGGFGAAFKVVLGR